MFRVVGGLIPVTNIWRELEMQILRELLKNQIKITQIVIIIIKTKQYRLVYFSCNIVRGFVRDI